jgi:transposase InsO family protein
MITHARQHYPAVSLRQLCALFQINRSWYLTRPSEQQVLARDVALRDAIEHIILELPGYGYRRVTEELHRRQWQVNHKRVLRIMRRESLLCHVKRRFTLTTDSQHSFQRYPNLLRERDVHAPNEVWVADITYICLPTTFVYLACMLDAFSRRCIGWELAPWLDTRLTLAALERALNERQPAPGLIHHSDHGVQYASSAYVERLQAAGAQMSMAAVGNPYDNAKAESFFKTLKYEEVYLKHDRTFAEAYANIATFIEDVYNAKRLHSSLGYRPPIEFEELYAVEARS